MTAQEAYLLARAYTNKVAEGGGAAKGAACQIKSITAITGGHRITFEWEDNAGNVETDTMDVMDGADGAAGVGISTIAYKEEDAQGNYIYTITLTSGSTYDITCPKGPQGATGATGADGQDGADGVGIASITKTGTAGLVDTYTITYTNGTTSTFTVTNGADANLTAGQYIDIDNDEISVKRDIARDVDAIITTSFDFPNCTVTKTIDEEVVDTVTFSMFGDIPSSVMDVYSVSYNGQAVVLTFTNTVASKEQSVGYTFQVASYSSGVVDTQTFVETLDADKKLIIKSELDAAINAIKDGQSIDSFADVETALGEKADTDIVASDFSTSASYTAGDYCIYEGKFYKFKNNHSGAWSAADVDEIKIAGELSSLMSGLTDLSDHVDGDATTYPYADVITVEDAIPANLKGCTVKIEPVQSGTGTPSPENVRPITGHTECTVTRVAKNLFDYSTCINYAIDNAGELTENSARLLSVIFAVTPNTNYIVEFPSDLVFIGHIRYDKNDNYVERVLIDSSSSPTIFRSTTDHVRLYFRKQEGTENINPSDVALVQCEKGSTSTAFEPYKGQQYTIALGDTIYGGKVRIDSNGNTVMDVDDVKRVFDGSEDETWTTRTTQSGYTLFEIGFSDTKSSTAQTQIGLCNEFPWSIGIETDRSYRYYQQTISIRYDGLTLAEFKEWLSNNELEVTLPLATPTTIQLTPTQIQLLQGTNTIYASTGDISVTVNGVSGAIGSMQEQVNEKIAGDVYSATGVKIGTWLGEDLYRKVVSLGVLPNNDTKLVSLHIANDEKPLFFTAFATNAVGNVQPLPYVDDYAKSADVLCDIVPVVDGVGFNMRIITAYDKSSYNGYCILYYTKTT